MKAAKDSEAVTIARAFLEEVYGEPVYPVSKFCDILNQWGEAIHAAHTSGQAIQGLTPGAEWHQYGGSILLAAHKSSMLGRLLWGREKLRTEACPEHRGHWSGLELLERSCIHGCQLTGWLPADEATK